MQTKIQIAKEIISSLDLNIGDCAFVFGSTASVADQFKVQQIRIFISDELESVKFAKIGECSDLDLRVISDNAILIRQKVDRMQNTYRKTPYLIEIKVDEPSYPLSDIKDTAHTSFFRRVLLSEIIPIFGQERITELSILANKYRTREDDEYDQERRQVYHWARQSVTTGNVAYLDANEAKKIYPVYYSKTALINERVKRQITPLQLLGNTSIEPWVEINLS